MSIYCAWFDSISYDICLCRVDQDIVLRFCEIRQVLRTKATWITMAPGTGLFHPTFGMDEQQRTSALQKINEMDPGAVRDAHLAFYSEANAAVSESWQRYINTQGSKRNFKTDLKATIAAARGLGVSRPLTV